MKSKYLLLACACALSSCSKGEDLGTVPDHQIQAIMTCLMGDVCNAPVKTIRTEGGGTMHMVSAKASSGLLYHYFYTDEQNFGVAITGDSRILMVRDDDLDGKIDHYGAGTPTVPPREAKVSESDSFYPEGQRVYLDLMAATPHIVPQEVRDALSKAGTI